MGKNWVALLWFELGYKFLGAFLGYSLFPELMTWVLKAEGVQLLSQANFGVFLSKPLVWLLLAAAFAVLVCYVYFEIAAFLLYCEAGWQGRRLSLLTLLKAAGQRLPEMFRWGNLPVFLGLWPVIALAWLPLTNGLLQNARLPEFVLAYIGGSPLSAAICLGVLALASLLLFFYLFGLPFVVLEGQTFWASWRSSLQLLKGVKWRTAGRRLGGLTVFFA